MRITSILFCLLISAGSLSAQDKTGDVKKNEKATTQKEAVFVAYEAVLSDGKLSLTKTVTGNGNGGSTTVYQLQNKSNPAFNVGKPLEIKLNKESFDNYFQKTTPELAQKWPQLVSFISEKKLSLNEEQGWISVLNYFNGLR